MSFLDAVQNFILLKSFCLNYCFKISTRSQCLLNLEINDVNYGYSEYLEYTSYHVEYLKNIYTHPSIIKCY